MAAAVQLPPPPPSLALPLDAPALSQKRTERRTPKKVATRSPGSNPTFATAFKRGKVEASLWAELADAREKGTAELHELRVSFPSGAAQQLRDGQRVESAVAKVTTKFGLGRAVLGVQLVLARRADGAETDEFNPEWHLVIKVQELGVVQIGRAQVHWAARLLLARDTGAAGQDLNGEAGALVAVVPDHRPPNSEAKVDERCREVHTARFLSADSPLMREIFEGKPSVWQLALTVRDAGGPPEDEVNTGAGCC